MDWRADIRETLRGMVREMMIDGALQATVKSVDKDAGTIVATGLKEDIDYFDVRLKAVLADGNGRGIIAYPVLGSQVSIVVLDGVDTMLFVSQMSDIESFLVKVDNGVSLELTAAGKVLLNGDSLGGLVKAAVVASKLNALETAVNALKTQMATHVHVLTTPTGAPFPGVIVFPNQSLASVALPATTATQLENPNVKHG
jgi:hypothetical protein